MTAELLRQAVGVQRDASSDDRLEATPEDLAAEQADVAARPLTRAGRRARAATPARLSPARALAGAAVSVSGVLLGIGTLLWVSDDPSQGPGPVVVQEPVAESPDLPAVPLEELPPAPSAAAPVVPGPPPAPPRAAARRRAARPGARAGHRPEQQPHRGAGRARRRRVRAGRLAGQGHRQLPRADPRRRPSTTSPACRRTAQAFADRFHGVRVRPRFATLPARGLVVVVTRDRA